MQLSSPRVLLSNFPDISKILSNHLKIIQKSVNIVVASVNID